MSKPKFLDDLIAKIDETEVLFRSLRAKRRRIQDEERRAKRRLVHFIMLLPPEIYAQRHFDKIRKQKLAYILKRKKMMKQKRKAD